MSPSFWKFRKEQFHGKGYVYVNGHIDQIQYANYIKVIPLVELQHQIKWDDSLLMTVFQ